MQGLRGLKGDTGPQSPKCDKDDKGDFGYDEKTATVIDFIMANSKITHLATQARRIVDTKEEVSEN